MGQNDELVDQYAIDTALDPDAMATEGYDGDALVSTDEYSEQGEISYEIDVDDVLEENGSLTDASDL